MLSLGSTCFKVDASTEQKAAGSQRRICQTQSGRHVVSADLKVEIYITKWTERKDSFSGKREEIIIMKQ